MIFSAFSSLLMFPILLMSYGFLYLYYTECHPWKSNGISVGFEPKDKEIWRPQLGKGTPGPIWKTNGQRFRLLLLVLSLDTIESEEASWAEGNWYQSNDLEELPSPSPRVIGRNQLPTMDEESVELRPLHWKVRLMKSIERNLLMFYPKLSKCLI